MRVLMFGWEFPPHQAGGLATATVGLVKGLLRVGVEVTLVVPFPVDGSPIDGLRLVGTAHAAPGLTVHRVPSTLQPYGSIESYGAVLARADAAGRPAAVYGATLLDEVERFARIAGDIAASEPHDLIDTHDWLTFEAGIAARQRTGRPLVAHIHATEFDRAGDHGDARIVAREAAGLGAADRVISNSHALKRVCVDRFAIAADRIDVVHWGVDAEPVPPQAPAPRHRSAQRRPVVLFVGRVTRQKGPDYFIEVAAKVARFEPRARFVVAGSGDLLPHIIRRSAELGIADRVTFTGGLSPADVARVYRMADVCVMPSVSEPFGLVALESLRAGTPCIMPRTAGVAEVVHNAFKVDCWDTDEMTNKIVALLRYPELQAELRAQGAAEVAAPRFGLEEPARRTAAAYQRALTSRTGAVHT